MKSAPHTRQRSLDCAFDFRYVMRSLTNYRVLLMLAGCVVLSSSLKIGKSPSSLTGSFLQWFVTNRSLEFCKIFRQSELHFIHRYLVLLSYSSLLVFHLNKDSELIVTRALSLLWLFFLTFYCVQIYKYVKKKINKS